MSEPTYSHDLDLSTVACTACGEFNLETELCFNCKGSLECINCCGCDHMSPCNWCGDGIEAGLWSVHKCKEEQSE